MSNSHVEWLDRRESESEAQQAALQAALDELAKCKQERDGLAAALGKYGTHIETCAQVSRLEGGFASLCFSENCTCGFDDCSEGMDLAAHDRAVAARVLRQTANGYLRDAVCDWQTTHITVGKELVLIAAQYEAGEREVPGE